MLKKTITYTDFDGNEQSDIFYFNLTKAEIIRLMAKNEDTGESLENRLTRIAKSDNKAEIVAEFEKFILSAFGERSEDGKRFSKSPEVTQGFKDSAAYDELLFSFFTGDDAGSDFINGIMPKSLMDEVNAEVGTGQSPSELARERSEANMQGHLTKRPAEATTVNEDDEKARRRAELQRQMDELNR